jgi:HlyD family secretion protein
LLAVLLSGCWNGDKDVNPSGTLEATEVDLAASIGGRVVEVRVQLGDRVSAGDTLVVLDTELIQLQRFQTQANHQSIVAERRLAEEDIHQAQRSLELAETSLGRLEALLSVGSTTQQQVDDLTAQRDVARIRLSAARKRLDVFGAREAELAAGLAVFDRQIQDGVLTAPSDGTVLIRNTEPGEMAIPGSTLLRIADLSRMEMRVFLDEEDLDLVRIGQTLPVLVDALEGEELTGAIIWISSEAEFTPKNVQTREARAQLVYAVKLRLANPDGRLHIGMPAEVRLGP